MFGAASAALAQTPGPAPVLTSIPAPTPAMTDPGVPAYSPKTQQSTQPPSPTLPVPEEKRLTAAMPATATSKSPYLGYPAYIPEGDKHPPDRLGSAYIPMDSWVYPALNRLYGMDFISTMYVGMRPYTRRSVLHMLQVSESEIRN